VKLEFYHSILVSKPMSAVPLTYTVHVHSQRTLLYTCTLLIGQGKRYILVGDVFKTWVWMYWCKQKKEVSGSVFSLKFEPRGTV